MRLLKDSIPSIRNQAAFLGLAALLVLTGCSTVEVWFGYRIRLEKTPMASMQASIPKGPGLVPGERTGMIVTMVGKDGQAYATEGKGKGKVLWEDLTVTSSIVTVDGKGRISLPADPRLSDGKVGHVVITAPSQPELRAELDIPPRYDASFTSNFRGGAGLSGMDGSAGMDGMSGGMGSFDPNNPSPGGNGTSGSNGSDGSDGWPGQDGPPVVVRVALKPGPRPLLMASCAGGGREEFFLVDPQGGHLTVRSAGGPGGTGGRGGRGGRGGMGGSGIPGGNSGSDGQSGRDGMDGRPGRDGHITVIYDPAVKPYLAAILPKGMVLGQPGLDFREAPVPPLW
jgi:hypothetical protein